MLELDESWQLVRAVRATQAIRETLLRTDTYPRLAATASGIADLSGFRSEDEQVDSLSVNAENKYDSL